MKKSKKLLSILLAVVMVFSVVAVPVSAAVPSNVTTLDALIQPSNLAGLVDWLLSSLNSRKTNYADSVLNFVCSFVEDINAEVPEGTNLFASNNTAAKATYVMDYLDKMLAETNLNEALGEDILNIINAIPGLTVDLNSVDGILNTLNSVEGIKGVAGGDIASLNLDSMIVKNLVGSSAQSRRSTGDLQIIYNLIQFLADNANVFKKFLSGKLNLGLVGSVAGDLQDQVNSYAGEITVMIEDLVYTKLLGAPDGKETHAESAYKDWTVDQMAVGALVKMLTGVVPDDTVQINEFLNLPVYDLLTSYGDMLYDKFLLGWLQNDLVGILKEFAQDNDLSRYFNFDFTFSASEFNFANAQNGILGEFNNVFVALLNKLLAPAVLAQLNLEKGGNDKLNANLEKVIKFILPKLADVVDPADFDFRKYTEEYVADKDLPELAVDILKIFFPGWFKLDDAAMDVVNQMDTMGEVATMAVYYALITFNTEMFAEGNYDYVAEWDALIFEEDGKTINDLSNSAWGDICLSMAADAAMYGLALNGDKFWFDFDMDDLKAAKAAGWTAEAFLDEIADWAIDMVKGIPAVTDHIGGASGKLDANGPFYKLNVLLNELLDWSFLNGVSYATFNLDIETLIFDGLLKNIYEFDLAGILGLFAVNDKTGNVLKEKTVPALLSIVDNVLNILFKHEGTTKTVKVAPTCDEEGYDIVCCSKCGLYEGSKKNIVAAAGHTKVAETVIAVTCQREGLVRYTCEKCDYVERVKLDKVGHTNAFDAFQDEDGTWWSGNFCVYCGKPDGEPTPVPPPSAIVIKEAPDTTEYVLNSEEELNLDGLVVKAVYGSREQDLMPGVMTVTKGLDITKAGEQTIEISYLGVTTTFTVKVVDKSAAEFEDSETAFVQGEGTVVAIPEVTVEQLLEQAGDGAALDREKLCTGAVLTLSDGTEYVIILLGDVTDDDGKVTASDARAALRNSVKLDTFTDVQFKAADVDGDEKISAGDARSLLRVSVKLDKTTDWLKFVK